MKEDLNADISVRAPKFATTKRSAVLLYPSRDAFFGLGNYPGAFGSQSSDLAFDSCGNEQQWYIQNK